ncbi:MAG: hypothetical protein AB1792_02910 [Candidatus Zixiibacteriota bacterium]
MARWRVFLAVSLALMLAALPWSPCVADDPGPGGGSPADGHPWDDQATDGFTPPGPGNPTDMGAPITKSPLVVGSTPMLAGSVKWVGDAMLRVIRHLQSTNFTGKSKNIVSRRR